MSNKYRNYHNMKKFSQHFAENKKNIIAGLELMSNKMKPEGYVYYGMIEIHYGGEIIYTAKFKSPKPLPSNAVYVTDGAFMVPGQKPDYVTHYPIILITDKELMSEITRDDYGTGMYSSFIRRLYDALKIDRNNEPVLP